MAGRNSGSKAAKTAKAASSAIAILALLALAGCSDSSSSPPVALQQSELANTEVHIMLEQCQKLEAGLYKCPAFEKMICDPDYNGEAKCIRTGHKGNIFVQSNVGN